jgi:hypothetical protein
MRDRLDADLRAGAGRGRRVEGSPR